MRHYKKLIAATVASVAVGAAYYTLKKNDYLVSYGPLVLPGSQSKEMTASPGYENAIKKSIRAVRRLQTEIGVPGLVVGVSVNGNIVWEQGIGLANVETHTPCNAQTKMRIASISKPITVILLAKLKESGLLDLDVPVQKYVPYLPAKTINGVEVTMTPQQLACHRAGIRHYNNPKPDAVVGDGGPEFYLKDWFPNVEKSVAIFKDDPLLFEPGKGFVYTTHGYTLLSAVLEGAGGTPFAKQLNQCLKDLGLHNTHLDIIRDIVYGRASYYARNKLGRLVNAKLTDNSYKWAGGGLVSTVGDLLRFANIMLYSYQNTNITKPGYLKQETVKELWTPVDGTKMSWGVGAGYGLGWTIVPDRNGWTGEEGQTFHVGHSGGAVGASSVLIIFPAKQTDNNNNNNVLEPPAGVAVAILANLQGVSMYRLGKEIAENFQQQGS